TAVLPSGGRPQSHGAWVGVATMAASLSSVNTTRNEIWPSALIPPRSRDCTVCPLMTSPVRTTLLATGSGPVKMPLLWSAKNATKATTPPLLITGVASNPVPNDTKPPGRVVATDVLPSPTATTTEELPSGRNPTNATWPEVLIETLSP